MKKIITAILKFLFSLHFKISGWRFKSDMNLEKFPKFVLVVGGHTSNWDFLYGMGCLNKINKKIKFTAKEELFRFPIKGFLETLGGIPIRRELNNGQKQTDIMADLFHDIENLCLFVTLEGTRQKVKKWKSGFYYIAQKAQVPIVLGSLDYKKKLAHLGEAIDCNQSFDVVMKKITDYYGKITPRNPQNFALDERYS